MKIKASLAALIDEEQGAGRLFGNLILALIVLSIGSFCIETLPDLKPQYRNILGYMEVVTVVIFSFEYLLRLSFAPSKPKFVFSFFGIIDLLAILPFFLGGPDLRSSRIFRLLRLMRAFKFLRYSKALRRFQHAFMEVRDELLIFLVATGFVLFLASVGIYLFEHEAQPDKFGSIFDGLWWAVATLTTVGYGDTYPITVGGRIFTFLILIVGLGVISVPSGLIASSLTKVMEEGKVDPNNTAEGSPDTGAQGS